MTENDPTLVSKFFEMQCTFLGVNPLATAAYHLQTNGQA